MSIEYLDLASEDCGCRYSSCPHLLAKRRVENLPPRQAVHAAARESPNSPFMKALSTCVLSNAGYRRSGAGRMFVKHIVEGKTEGDRPHWETSLIGVINIFAGILQEKSEIQDDAIHQELLGSYPGIIQVLWKGMAFLTTSGNVADGRRNLVARVISFFSYDPSTKRKMYDAKTLKVLLNCWLLSSPDSNLRKRAVDTTERMFLLFDGELAPPPDYMGRLFNAISPAFFTTQINVALKHKKLLDVDLAEQLSLLHIMAHDTKTCVPILMEGRVHKQVAAAMRRQLKNGQEDKMNQVLLHGYNFTMHIILNTKNGLDIFTDLLANTVMVEVAAAGMKISNRFPNARGDGPGYWIEFFDRIKHTMTCKNFESCNLHATPKFLEAARTSLERIAVPTLLALQEEEMGDRKYLRLWRELVQLLGIFDDTIRERYKLERKCCNLKCPTRNAGLRSEKKGTCVICHSVFYCNRECQKGDWKYHEAECSWKGPEGPRSSEFNG